MNQVPKLKTAKYTAAITIKLTQDTVEYLKYRKYQHSEDVAAWIRSIVEAAVSEKQRIEGEAVG